MSLRKVCLIHALFSPLEVKCSTLQGHLCKIGKLEEFNRLPIADLIGTDFKLKK